MAASKRPKPTVALTRELFEKHRKTFDATLAVAVELAVGAGLRRRMQGVDGDGGAYKFYDVLTWIKALGESLAPVLQDAEQQGYEWKE